MLWKQLTDLNQLTDIINASKSGASSGLVTLIFKHSTRCSISSMALNRMETKWKDTESVHTYYLDLISHRDVSNAVAAVFGVEHASPQVLLIKNGTCFYHNSHNGISVLELTEAIEQQG